MDFSNEFENSQKIQGNTFEDFENLKISYECNNNNDNNNDVNLLSRTIVEKNYFQKNSFFISKKLIEHISSNSNSYEQIEFLEGRELIDIENDTFDQIVSDIINDDETKKVSEYIFNLNYNFKQYSIDDTIGPCIIITELIESSFHYDKQFLDEMKKKFNLLANFSYFRRIKGDGNCFYRAVIFKYIEMIILSGNCNLLKNIIYDLIFNCFNFNDKSSFLEYLKIGTQSRINDKLLKQILIIIYQYMKEKHIKEAYKIFYVSFNTCRGFDMGMIFYFRYCLYEFISKNEKKLYTKDFPILIGNLLPESYEINGDFDFQSFYKNYLLKLFTDAEKIIIYLTPFVLNTDLNIFVYDGNQNDNIQKITCPNLLNKDYIIYTSITNSHYELIYLTNEYEKYKNYLIDYTNIDYQPNFLKDLFEQKKININSSLNEIEQVEKSLSSGFNILDSSKKFYDDNPLNEEDQFQIGINKVPNDINLKNRNENEKNKRKENKIIYEDNSNHLYKNPESNNSINENNQFKKVHENNDSSKDIYEINQNISQIIANNKDIEKNKYQKKKENKTNKGNSKIIVNKKNIKAKKYQKFLQAYQSYIQKIKKTIKDKKDEEKQNFIISKYYDILNNMQDLSEFLDSIKEQFCLNCESNFNNSKSIKLPCGCCMCNIECIINAFTSFNKLEGINLFCCVCSHIYKPEELYQLGLIFFKNNNNNLYNNIVLLFNKLICQNCSLCNNILNEKKKKFSYKNNNNIDILGDYKTLKHFLCFECSEKIKREGNKFFCIFCKKYHLEIIFI